MGCEDGVDQGGFPKTSLACTRQSVQAQRRRIVEHTNADDIELETSLQKLLLDLRRDAIETDVASWENGIPLVHGHGHFGERLRASERR